MSESKGELQIHAEFSAWLRKERIPFVHCDPTRKATIQPGWPDYTIVWHRNVLLIEVKAEKGKLSPEQVECHAELDRTGTSVFVARSMADCVAAVDSLRRAFPTAEKWVQKTIPEERDLFLLHFGGATMVVRKNALGSYDFVRRATPADYYPPVQS